MIHDTDIYEINQTYPVQIFITLEKIVMLFKKLQLVFVLVLFGLGLAAVLTVLLQTHLWQWLQMGR